MATATSTAVANNVIINNHSGVNSISVDYNSGATNYSVSQTTILMCRVPHGATITGMNAFVTAGSATAPYDIGISGVSLSAFGNAVAAGSVSHGEFGLPYDVSQTDTAVPYQTVAISPTVSSTTASVKASLTVYYTMNQNRVKR